MAGIVQELFISLIGRLLLDQKLKGHTTYIFWKILIKKSNVTQSTEIQKVQAEEMVQWLRQHLLP